MTDPYLHVDGTDDLYECIDCRARRLPGVLDEGHKPDCVFAPEPEGDGWGRVTKLMGAVHVEAHEG